jgi:hypothetical protein
MSRKTLIRAVLLETDRVWGEDGFGGKPNEYAWLAVKFGITYDQDVQWQLILDHACDCLEDDELSDEELMSSLADDDLVTRFLNTFLEMYQRSSAVFPRPVSSGPVFDV